MRPSRRTLRGCVGVTAVALSLSAVPVASPAEVERSVADLISAVEGAAAAAIETSERIDGEASGSTGEALAGEARAFTLSRPVTTSTPEGGDSPPGTPPGAPPTPPLPPPPGSPITVRVGPPANLVAPLTVARTGNRTGIPDRPGVRTARITTATGDLPSAAVVAAAPGSFSVLGDASATTVIEAGLVRRGQDVQLSTPQGAQLAWLLAAAPARISASPQPEVEAAAIQIAAWTIMRTSGLGEPPTDNPTVNARATQILAEATVQTVADRIALAAPAQTCLDVMVPVRVTGPPAGTTTLTISGPGIIDRTTLRLDATGTGSVNLRATRTGAIELVASATNGEPVRINTNLPDGSLRGGDARPEGRSNLLELLTLEQREITGRLVVSAADCLDPDSTGDLVVGSSRTGTGPATPGLGALRATRRTPVDVLPNTGKLPKLVVTGAKVLVTGRRSRVLRVIVRNTSSSATGKVVITALAPKGTAVTSVRNGSARQRVISWKLTRIPARQNVTVLATLSGKPTDEVDPDRVVIFDGAAAVSQWERPLATPRSTAP